MSSLNTMKFNHEPIAGPTERSAVLADLASLKRQARWRLGTTRHLSRPPMPSLTSFSKSADSGR